MFCYRNKDNLQYLPEFFFFLNQFSRQMKERFPWSHTTFNIKSSEKNLTVKTGSRFFEIFFNCFNTSKPFWSNWVSQIPCNTNILGIFFIFEIHILCSSWSESIFNPFLACYCNYIFSDARLSSSGLSSPVCLWRLCFRNLCEASYIQCVNSANLTIPP